MSSYLETPYLILARGPWRAEDIATRYWPPSTKPLDVVVAAKQQREPALVEAARRSRGHLFNGGIYGLQKFSNHHGPAGRPRLSLDFTSSSYFDTLCLDSGLDQPLTWHGKTTTLRQELFGQQPKTAIPSPHLVNFFGFGGLIITSDNFAILTRRDSSMAIYPNYYTSSVDEGSAFPEDSDGRGGVDLLHMAARGAKEELDLDTDTQNVTFLSLAVNLELNNYFIVATITTPLTKAQVQAHLAQNLAVDAWERGGLYFVPWDPKSITRFMNRHSPWVSVTVLEAIRHAFGPPSL